MSWTERAVEYTDVVGLLGSAVVAAFGESVARKMTAGKPALLFPLRETQSRPVMPQLSQIRAHNHRHHIQPSQFETHQHNAHQHHSKHNSPTKQKPIIGPRLKLKIQINN